MVRLFLHSLVAVLPWWAKNPIYRHLCGYRIGRRVRIGLSPLAVGQCSIGDDTRIGHLNLFWRTKELRIEDHVRIGHLNLFRGGDLIHLERFVEIFRANVINSIPEPEVENPIFPTFRLGAGSVLTTSHWLDFTDSIDIGCRSIVGGRNSSLWTHSRQWTRPIKIGSFVYLGSEVRLAPGARVPAYSVVGIASVIIDEVRGHGYLIAGSPARAIKKLEADGQRLLVRKTRRDLPDGIGAAELERIETEIATASRLASLAAVE
jgi:hypothetical protein